MALMAYLRLKGQRSGEIKGSATQKGQKGRIGVIAASHGIVSPRDLASGLPTGRRMHKPFVITKELDASSPLLYTVLATNENITEFELQFWAPTLQPAPGAASAVQIYTVKLVNANIASIDFHMPNIRHPDLKDLAEYEEIAFTYQRIEWTWTKGGVTAMDDWVSH
jgi:type VI secretion system secreted protein Hcp